MSELLEIPPVKKAPIEKFAKELFEDLNAYPLPVRIAAKLHDTGYTEADLHKAKFPHLPAPLLHQVQGALRDIERGFTKVTPRLLELARAM